MTAPLGVVEANELFREALLSQSLALACVESDSGSPSCDCLAHRFGNAADGPERAPCYGPDMKEAEWQIVRALLPVPAWLEGRGGRPEGYCHRQMIDAVRYVVDNGVKWANLLCDFLPFKRVHAFARRWQIQGLLTELHDRLRDRVRQKEGRAVDPTAAIVDSQSLRAAANIPRSTSGWDGGKKVAGRKRHLVVDCLGLALVVMVTESSVHRDQSSSPREPSSSRTRRWSLAHTRALVHSVNRRCAVAPDGPNDSAGSCCQVQPDVATNTIAASTSWSPCRRRPPP